MKERTPQLLLHLCCGPCAITTIAAALADGFAATGLFYNPNIHPLQEYFKRREGAAQVAERSGIPLRFCALEYDPRLFLRAVHGREEDRCRHCYALRLERAESIDAYRMEDVDASGGYLHHPAIKAPVAV